MFCDKCGLKLADGDLFCGGCGNKIVPVQGFAPVQQEVVPAKEVGFAPSFGQNDDARTPDFVPENKPTQPDFFSYEPVAAPEQEKRDIFSGFENKGNDGYFDNEDRTVAVNNMKRDYTEPSGDIPFDQQGYNQPPVQPYYPGENSYGQNYGGGNGYADNYGTNGYGADQQTYYDPSGNGYGGYADQNGTEPVKPKKNGSKTVVIIVLLVAIIAAIGAGVYFFFFADKGEGNADTGISSSDVADENKEGNEGGKTDDGAKQDDTVPTFSGGVDSMGNVAPETTVDGEVMYIRAQDGTYLRTGPGSDSIKTIKLEKGAAVKIMGTTASAENWYYVKSESDGALGWIEKSATSEKEVPKEGNGNVVPDTQTSGEYFYIKPEAGLKLRTGPGEDYNETTFLARGEAVKQLGKHSTAADWSYVEIYNGSGFGWVKTSDLAETNPDTSRQNKYYQYPSTFTATVEPSEGLRIRAAATTDAEIYEVMDQGTVVTVVGYSAYDVHWRYIRVTINGTKMEGFVHNDYLISPEG